MIVVRVGNSRFRICRETWCFHFDINLEFPIGMKLGVYSKLSWNGGTSLSKDLEIIYFADVVRDGNGFRWART
jgi:hypothetical protein